MGECDAPRAAALAAAGPPRGALWHRAQPDNDGKPPRGQQRPLSPSLARVGATHGERACLHLNREASRSPRVVPLFRLSARLQLGGDTEHALLKFDLEV